MFVAFIGKINEVFKNEYLRAECRDRVVLDKYGMYKIQNFFHEN